jgi:SAM-dependent methyltransferase
MHPTAIKNCKNFFEVYSKNFTASKDTKIIEIGSRDVNGSFRDICPEKMDYIGVDFIPGENVDVVLSDAYHLPFKNESIDIIISSSCFEHSEMFWVTFLEALRILKPGGLFYINVPSRGSYHRYPLDCWRFYPDSSLALITWAKKNGFNAELLETYTQPSGGWGDLVAIFLKDGKFLTQFQERILNKKKDFINGRISNRKDEILKLSIRNQHWYDFSSFFAELLPRNFLNFITKIYKKLA